MFIWDANSLTWHFILHYSMILCDNNRNSYLLNTSHDSQTKLVLHIHSIQPRNICTKVEIYSALSYKVFHKRGVSKEGGLVGFGWRSVKSFYISDAIGGSPVVATCPACLGQEYLEQWAGIWTLWGQFCPVFVFVRNAAALRENWGLCSVKFLWEATEEA
jgi:hypothetical protein